MNRWARPLGDLPSSIRSFQCCVFDGFSHGPHLTLHYRKGERAGEWSCIPFRANSTGGPFYSYPSDWNIAGRDAGWPVPSSNSGVLTSAEGECVSVDNWHTPARPSCTAPQVADEGSPGRVRFQQLWLSSSLLPGHSGGLTAHLCPWYTWPAAVPGDLVRIHIVLGSAQK